MRRPRGRRPTSSYGSIAAHAREVRRGRGRSAASPTRACRAAPRAPCACAARPTTTPPSAAVVHDRRHERVARRRSPRRAVGDVRDEAVRRAEVDPDDALLAGLLDRATGRARRSASTWLVVFVERGVALLEVALEVAQRDQLLLDAGEVARARTAPAARRPRRRGARCIARCEPLDLGRLLGGASPRRAPRAARAPPSGTPGSMLLVVADRDAGAREQVLGARHRLLQRLVGVVERARPRQRGDALRRRRAREPSGCSSFDSLEERRSITDGSRSNRAGRPSSPNASSELDALSTAARALGVRVVELEAVAHHPAHEVERHAAEEHEALRIDDDRRRRRRRAEELVVGRARARRPTRTRT